MLRRFLSRLSTLPPSLNQCIYSIGNHRALFFTLLAGGRDSRWMKRPIPRLFSTLLAGGKEPYPGSSLRFSLQEETRTLALLYASRWRKRPVPWLFSTLLAGERDPYPGSSLCFSLEEETHTQALLYASCWRKRPIPRLSFLRFSLEEETLVNAGHVAPRFCEPLRYPLVVRRGFVRYRFVTLVTLFKSKITYIKYYTLSLTISIDNTVTSYPRKINSLI